MLPGFQNRPDCLYEELSMTDKTHHSGELQRPFFVFIGILLAISYWVIDAYFDSALIVGASFATFLLPADPNETWMRSLVSVLFVGFGLYSHRAHLLRIEAAMKLNVDAAWLLKNALDNTIRGHFPICDSCKNIRDEDDQWVTPDSFIAAQTEAQFLRVVCDQCQIEER